MFSHFPEEHETLLIVTNSIWCYIQMTLSIQVVDSWYFVNSLYVSSEMTAHVFEGDNVGFANVFKQPNTFTPGPGTSQQSISGCGTDIQLHSSKGAIGLRVDGTQNLKVSNVHVHDIYNWADLGSEQWCGPYPGPTVGNEDIDIQYGYTGSRSHGVVVDYVQGILENVQIENIESWHGEANGMTVYKGCDIGLSNILVDAVHAGTRLQEEEVLELNSPNLTPRACGVDIRPNTNVFIDEESGIVIGGNITGFETCYMDRDGELDRLNAEMYSGKWIKRMKVRQWASMDGVWMLALLMTVSSVCYVLRNMLCEGLRRRRMEKQRIFDVTDLVNQERRPLLSEPYICI